MGMVDTNIYWMLPGPQDFVNKICQALADNRTVIVNTPHYNSFNSVWNGIYRGVRNAHYEDPVHILVKYGTDISSDVAVHFGMKRMSAARLAEHKADSKRVVILRAEDGQATANCERYALDFIRATENEPGNVRLVTIFHLDQFQIDNKFNGFYVITFDEGVSFEEMDAYVNIRMLSKKGPGSTRLSRALVTEFSGFDLQFAERLILLPDDRLVSIREELSSILGEFPGRWTNASWLNGGKSISSNHSHVLYDQYKLNSGTTDEKIRYRSAIDKRYWRACLKALTPWLEERKSQILGHFESHLATISKNHNGKIPIPRKGGNPVLIDIMDLEYNNIVGMVNNRIFCPFTSDEVAAVEICRLAKKVRDKIAHLQAPNSSDVEKLILAMDQFLGDSPLLPESGVGAKFRLEV